MFELQHPPHTKKKSSETRSKNEETIGASILAWYYRLKGNTHFFYLKAVDSTFSYWQLFNNSSDLDTKMAEI